MYCILLSIVRRLIVFGVLLSKLSLSHLILALCNFLVLSRSSARWCFGCYIYEKEKSLFDELAATSRPISLEYLNLYVFRGEFKDLVTSLTTKTKPLSYADIHSHLLTHEFLHKTSLQSIAVNPPLLPTPPLPPSANVAQYQSSATYNNNLISAVTEDVFMAAGVPIATTITTNTSLIFMAFRGLLIMTRSRETDNKTEGILVLHSCPLTAPLRIMSSASSTTPLAIQPLNALNFVAMDNSRPPILFLVMALLLTLWIGSRTLEWINMLHLILRHLLGLNPILVMIVYMLVMINAFLYPILDIPCYIPQNTFLPYLLFFMCLILQNLYFMFRNFIVIILPILNFMLLCFM